MAKTRIKRLKTERFWRWMIVEVYQKPGMAEWYGKHPIKQRRYRLRKRRTFWRELKQMQEKAWESVQSMLEERRAIAAGEGKGGEA